MQVFGWDGKFRDAIDLPAESPRICWLDRTEIVRRPDRRRRACGALGPSDAFIGAAVGRTSIPATAPGARPAHANLLRYAAARGELFILDAFSGELSVFDRKGKLLRQGHAPES